MLQLKDVTLQVGSKLLLDHADLMVFYHQKIGIVGRNGVGKSSLFKLILGELRESMGKVIIQNGVTMAHIQQEVPTTDQSAVDYALEGNVPYHRLNQRLLKAEADNDGEAMAAIHHEMSEIGAYALPAEAAKVLLGLGFSQAQLHYPINHFSGGWRMRLNLAQVLLANADILLLDEPTNHLDLEAILWLEQWLTASQQTVLLISHDREFLDKVTSHIVHVEAAQLNMYTGNYSDFERMHAAQLVTQQAAYVKQEQKRQHLQSFVDRFSAGTRSKQAQSRVKMLEKMDVVAQVHLASSFRFSFKPCASAGTPMLSIQNVNAGYGNTPVLKNLNVSISDGQRIGLIGPNGAGKSTFIKLLAKELEPMAGQVVSSNKIKVGYFAQHQLEQLNPSESAYAHFVQMDKKIMEKEARQYLGNFNFRGDDVFRPVESFSGGEKSRLIMAMLIWQAPNLLLLDEPTNHLDLEVRESLALALQEYQGAVVLVSHDRYLLKSVVDEFLLVADHVATPFDGDMDDYRKWYDTRMRMERDLVKKPMAEMPNADKKESAKKVAYLESVLKKVEASLAEIDAVLCQPDMYADENKDRLRQLTFERKKIHKEVLSIESKLLALLG